MAYVSLYRKYRPQTFAEIVGQDHVTRSLVNALAEDRLHHAYLFTGPRGTGKTSTARILAKSVNCEQGPTPTPCNTCAQCVAITNGTSVDVIELDMASHGGVDDARELRDRARFSPASARRKVYILDEVHMASTAAFNALLKLIEEPPAHVLFAMATTDPQKVLPTIMSRVQRLDLRRVGARDVAGRVADLVAREGGTIDQAALDAVVRAGDGSLRDTESVLEQVLSYAEGGNITGADVEEVLGQTPFESTGALVDAIVAGDLAAGFATVQELLDRGADLRVFATDLVGHVRDLLVLVVAPERPDLVDATDERRGALVAQAEHQSASVLTMLLDELAAALDAMRKGEGARLAVELAVAKAVAQVAPSDAVMPRLPGSAGAPAGTGTSRDTGSTAGDPSRDVDATAADADAQSPAEADVVSPADAGVRSPTDPDAGSATEDATSDAPADDSPASQAEPEPAPAEPAPAEPEPAEPEPDPAEPEPVEPEEEGSAADAGAVGDHDTTATAPGADLAARATARSEQVAREGMPTPATTRPDGPSVERDAPPDPDEVAQLELIQSRWQAVLELVRAESVRAEAMLARARPTRLRRRVLLLSYPASHHFHAGQVASQEFDDVLVPAIERTCDVRVRIDVEVDGAPVGGGHPKPDEPAAATSASPARRAAARAAGGAPGSAAQGARGGPEAPASGPAGSGGDGEREPRMLPATAPDGEAAAPDRNPMAELDPSEAMDRAAAALVDHLGAVEVDPDIAH